MLTVSFVFCVISLVAWITQPHVKNDDISQRTVYAGDDLELSCEAKSDAMELTFWYKKEGETWSEELEVSQHCF